MYAPKVPQIVPRFDFRVSFKAVEDIGRSREKNEDAHLVAPELGLFAVADGMGGHAAGEIASKLAIEEVRRSVAGEISQKALDVYVHNPSLETRRLVYTRLRRAVEHANARIRLEAANDKSLEGMGTTIDIAWLARDHAFIAHTGDSRVYLARSNTMLQLTQDHAELDSLKATGVLSHYGRNATTNRLLNAVGLKDTVVVDTLFVDLNRGDRLLLCTDGVHGQIAGEPELAELLRAGSAEDAARALVRRASVKGRDNATAVVVEINDRFVRRESVDHGVRARDLERAKLTPLLVDLPLSQVMSALAAAVEIEVRNGDIVPQVIASDLVTYIVIEGLVRCGPDRLVSVGALLFPESLVGVVVHGELPVTEQTTRLLRLRADDFAEVCEADPRLGAELYRRLAGHLARARQRDHRPGDD